MGEILTRATVWMALAGYTGAVVEMLLATDWRRARVWWTVGCAAYVAHVVCAFHYYYGWSHGVGLGETARQTEELTGMRSGGGLYLNYLFTAVWVADAAWWWRGGLARYRARASVVRGTLHAFFLFMVVNGTVVFGRGPVRWFGVAIVAVIMAAGVRAWRHR